MQAMAGVDDAGIAQPLDAAGVIPASRTVRDAGDLKFLVFPGELEGNGIEHALDARLIKADGVLAHVFAVIGKGKAIKKIIQCSCDVHKK